MPGPRPGGRGSEDTLAVVAMLRALPSTWASRDAFVAAVVAEGRSVTLARWLAMNLAPSVADSFTLRLDLDAISALLDDYFAVDLWPVLSEPPEDARVSIVARAHAIAEAREGTTLEVIEGAGHWVHVDAPDALIVAWSAALP
jgi:pimeloyl-ACP methyl ester carboxylesterase